MVSETKVGGIHDRLAIRIRLYKNSDAEQIRQLFKTAMATGDDSQRRMEILAQLSSPQSFTLYVIIVLGLLSSAWSSGSYQRYVGVAVSIAALSTVGLRAYSLHCSFMDFVQYAISGDLSNIANSYGMVGNLSKGYDLYATGKNCFWVAETDEEDSELVGYVGLDVNTTPDPCSAELRRMVVSPKSRRRGVAGQLIQTAIGHARIHDIKAIYITTSSHNAGAINLYKRFGWVIRKRYTLFGSIPITELNLVVPVQ